MGVHCSRIVFANPCKSGRSIQTAKTNGIGLMTFDNLDELYKIRELYPDASLILRILVDDTGAASRMSQKFGADRSYAKKLLQAAKSLGLDVVGVSFHVGEFFQLATLFGQH